jgi:hypothetical protein
MKFEIVFTFTLCRSKEDVQQAFGNAGAEHERTTVKSRERHRDANSLRLHHNSKKGDLNQRCQGRRLTGPASCLDVHVVIEGSQT